MKGGLGGRRDPNDFSRVRGGCRFKRRRGRSRLACRGRPCLSAEEPSETPAVAEVTGVAAVMGVTDVLRGAAGGRRRACRCVRAAGLPQVLWSALCTCAVVAAAVPFSYSGSAAGSLNYQPRIANAPAEISFSVVTNIEDVPAGSEIEVSLPGFSVCDNFPCIQQRAMSLIRAQNVDAAATWDEVSQKLTIRILEKVVAGTAISAAVNVSAGLRLPRAGVPVDKPELTIGGASFKSPAVGSFVPAFGTAGKDTAIEYRMVAGGEVKAGRRINLELRFLHRMPLSNGDTVTVTLPYFNGADFARFEVKNVPEKGKFFASWNSLTYKLKLGWEGQELPPPENVHTITVEDRLSVASYGVDLNDVRITIESNALFGPVAPVPITSSPRVIGVVARSSLSFCDSDCTFDGFQWLQVTDRARPADSAEIIFTFEFREDILQNEEVVLRLPGFGGPDRPGIPLSIKPLCRIFATNPGARLPVDSGDPVVLEQHPYGCVTNTDCMNLRYAGSAVLNRASWSRSAQTLTMTAGQVAAKGMTHVVVVPKHAGITLPYSGVRGDNTMITLERCGVPCDAGPIPPAPLSTGGNLTEVGALSNLTVTFEPALPEESTTIGFSFAPAMDLETGDVLNVTLATFDDSSVPTEPMSLSSSTGHFISALWSRPSRTLMLTCATSSAAGLQIRFRLSSAYGFKLPLDGVVPGSAKYLFSLEAAKGPISKTRIVEIQRVPAVLDSTILSYSQAPSGFNFSSLTFQFTTRKRLTQGDAIVLHLKHFRGKPTQELPGPISAHVESSKQLPDFSFQAASCVRNFSFDPSQGILALQLRDNVELLDTIQIKFLQSAGIALPVFGMAANSPLLTVSAHFVDGLVMHPVQIATSPAVAPVLALASLTFGNVRAGTATRLTLEVAPAFNGGFVRGDTISLSLPDFGFRAPSPISAAILSKRYFNQANWTGNLLTFTVFESFAQSVNVTLTELAGIVLPDEGVRAATQKITIEGVVKSHGSFVSTVIPHVQAVGAFQGLGNMGLVFTGTNPEQNTPPIAGLKSGIRLQFRAHMVLHPGDTITLGLSGFTGPSESRIDPNPVRPSEGLTSNPPDAFRRASWDMSGLMVLTVGSKQPIAALTEINLAFPPNVFNLPVTGVGACTDSFLNSTNAICPIYVSAVAREGDILKHPRTWVTGYSPVGRLEFSSVRFTPLRSGIPVEIDLRFRLSQDILKGFVLSVEFLAFTMPPGFQQVESTSVFGESVFSDERATISWRSRNTAGMRVEVSLRSTKEAPAGTLQHIRLPITSGITMPARGLPWEVGPAVIMSIVEEATSVRVISGVPVVDIGRVGALMDSSFLLDPPAAGYVTEFSIRFTPSMTMYPGEYINFYIPTFTGDTPTSVTVVSVISMKCDSSDAKTANCENVPYITTVRWEAQSESFNATVAQEIPINTKVLLIVGRDARISIPGSGLGPEILSRVMFASTWARHGVIYRQPIATSVATDSILKIRDLEVMPKRADRPTEIKLSLLVSYPLNPGATVLAYMPGFSGGRDCWNALPGDPAMQLRCLAESREENCGTPWTPGCSPDDLRYCGDFSPYLNAFLKRPKGGCRFVPKTYLGSHSKPLNFSRPIQKQVGSCRCLEGAEYRAAFASVHQFYNVSGAGFDRYQLPGDYGSKCWPWDSQSSRMPPLRVGEQVVTQDGLFAKIVSMVLSDKDGQRDQPVLLDLDIAGIGLRAGVPVSQVGGSPVDCYKLFRGASGPHCCSSYCFVKDNCPSAVEWHGFKINSTTAATTKVYISYQTCDDRPAVVETCPYKFPQEGLSNFATGSWTEYDSLLVLTLLQPIVAFTPINFFVPIELGVRVPGIGLGEAFTQLDIDVFDVESNTRMDAVSVDILDSIGAFFNSTLICDDYTPGMPSSLTVRFTPLMPIVPGETVSFILKDFESETTRIQVSSEPGNFRTAYWDPDSETLTLTASQVLKKEEEMTVYITKVLRLPVQGISPRSEMFIYTDSGSGRVPRDEAFPIVSLVTVGSLWNTVVSFEPPVYDQDMEVTFEFQSKLPLKEDDSVELVMEGFTGPSTKGTNAKIIGLTQAEPKETFNVYWQNDDGKRPTVTIVISREIVLPADTFFKLVIPRNCTFKDAARNCLNERGISRSSAVGTYDPRSLWVSVRSPNICGFGCDRVVDKSLVRMSSVLAASRLQALAGTWTGFSYAASGFSQEYNVSHLMTCLSAGFRCPSRAAYKCNTIETPIIFTSDGSRARISHSMNLQEITALGSVFNSAYRGGDFELISRNGHELRMKNVTASEYLVDDDATRIIDTDGETFCSFSRAVYRVDLDGNYDTALELYTEYIFQSASASTTFVRLRLNITADPIFNPVGLELYDDLILNAFRRAFARAWRVPPENVVFSSSARYLPTSRCNKLPTCNTQLFVYAATPWQQQNGKLWARQIFESIYASKDDPSSLQYNLLKDNLIMFITVLERLYLSPNTIYSPSCPEIIMGRMSQPFANWRSPAGVDVGSSESGFATKNTATCLRRNGVDIRDTIAYGEGYTVDFGVVSLLTRQSSNATAIDQFDPNGNSNDTRISGNNVTMGGGKEKSVAARGTGSASVTFLALFLTGALVHTQRL